MKNRFEFLKLCQLTGFLEPGQDLDHASAGGPDGVRSTVVVDQETGIAYTRAAEDTVAMGTRGTLGIVTETVLEQEVGRRHRWRG